MDPSADRGDAALQMESAAYGGLFFALLLCGLTDHCLLPLALWSLHISFLQLKSPLEGGVSKYATNRAPLPSERTAPGISSRAQTLTCFLCLR